MRSLSCYRCFFPFFFFTFVFVFYKCGIKKDLALSLSSKRVDECQSLCSRNIKVVLRSVTMARRLMEVNRMRFLTPQESLSWCFKVQEAFTSNSELLETT